MCGVAQWSGSLIDADCVGEPTLSSDIASDPTVS